MGCCSSVSQVVTNGRNNLLSDEDLLDPHRDLDMYGVSVHWLKNGFLKEVMDAGFTTKSKIYDIENLDDIAFGPIRSKGADTISPIDGKLGAAYVHSLDRNNKDLVGPATLMLSYGWGNTVGDIIYTLVEYCKANNLKIKRTYCWICCLCNNQHRVAQNRLEGNEISFATFRDIFHKRVTGIGHVVALMSPWRQPVYLSRAWCIFELFTANEDANCQLSIVMPNHDKSSMMDALDDIDELYDVLASTMVQNANASEPEDRKRILSMVKDGPGYVKFNYRINSLLRKWIMDTVLKEVEYHKSRIFTDGKISVDASRVEKKKLGNMCYKVGEIVSVHNGDYREGLLLHRQGVAIYEELYGKDAINNDLAASHNSIGCILDDVEEYDEAIKEYQIALDMDLKLKTDAETMANGYNNLGVTMRKNGDPDNAMAQYMKALACFDDPENEQKASQTYNNIGTIHSMKGDNEKAIEYYNKSLAIDLKCLGDMHPDTAMSFNNVASLQDTMGLHSSALENYQKARHIWAKTLGEDNQDTIEADEAISTIEKKLLLNQSNRK